MYDIFSEIIQLIFSTVLSEIIIFPVVGAVCLSMVILFHQAIKGRG